ncbi:MAG: hypothetical protein ACFE7E_08950, partial [Candidatus Hodarchaeota archaeon]
EENDSLTDNKLALLQRFLAFKPFSEDNLAEEIIKEKQKFQKTSLVQIINLIAEREKAKQRNMRSLDSEIMDVQSQLYVYRCHVYPISPDNKRKSNLERALSELENRRRQEDIACWKDTLKLWQRLLEIIAEYRATLRKVALITEIQKADDKDRLLRDGVSE